MPNSYFSGFRTNLPACFPVLEGWGKEGVLMEVVTEFEGVGPQSGIGLLGSLSVTDCGCAYDCVIEGVV